MSEACTDRKRRVFGTCFHMVHKYEFKLILITRQTVNCVCVHTAHTNTHSVWALFVSPIVDAAYAYAFIIVGSRSRIL